ncbi:MAG: MBOAT family protein [Oscillospiraceae bacterium]|nr:MBOAT family protein [Oscillospiraceae bacterium]
MLFSSISFLYYFLPCVILLYYIAPKKLKNLTLLISSLVFYAWGEPKYVILMAIGIINGYISGLLIEKFIGTKKAAVVLWISVLINIGCLGYFKYADFFIENINAATGLSIPFLKIALPVGISFYTFQILSYTVDVYRKEVNAQRSIIDLAAYVSMFPQLIAGPIVRYADVAAQLKERTHSFEKAASGIRMFVIGLGKKVLIANALGELCNAYSANTDNSVLLCWMYAFAYSLQIYFDFSGYSDMAVGLGRIFGFELCENFRYPYISQSITEFWRRWHISLGTWFRDYVYIPLGGNRVSKLGHIRNILVVWMLTGFWHGAAWNFIIWGLYFAVFLMIEKFFLLKSLKKTKIIGHIYVLLAVLVSFVIFGSSNLSSAVKCLGGMFGFRGLPFASELQMYYLRSFVVILILAVVGATPLPKKLAEKISKIKDGAVLDIIEPVFLVGITVLSTAYLVDGSFNPFMYFRF